MKPFDFEAAKNGAPVQTRDGRPARIIRWGKKPSTHPIIALLDEGSGREVCLAYTKRGYYYAGKASSCRHDLVMAPAKNNGWVNIYKRGGETRDCSRIFNSKAEAEAEANAADLIDTVEIEWKE